MQNSKLEKFSFENKIIRYSFYALFAVTPLVWTSFNYELFEFSKMLFVYALTTIITTVWILKMIQKKALILKRTPLDIPILIFLASQIISTLLSIDPHVSWWGYYSRQNGGLYSIIAYTILYYAFVSNFESKDVLKFLKAALIGGLVVSLYAIPEHFGVSPSCVILHGQFTASCWVQDVQARVFATLGQPNWLGAYLAMLIFPALYFCFTASSKLSAIRYTLLTILLYLSLTFTYSRGATLGLLAGFGVFAAAMLINFKKIAFVLLAVFLINIFFGSAFNRFNVGQFFQVKPAPSIAERKADTTKPAPAGGTQLENGGTESGKIRLIVWKGALEIFRKYPWFGTGVETFAFSYYQFRPTEHNLVSEWDFLYNKAHNEFLNYAANTGAVGFLAYMSIIVLFIIWNIKQLKSLKPNKDFELLTLNFALLASYISYLVQNFFGFSVVIIAVFFYLFPALSFLAAGDTKDLSWNITQKLLKQKAFKAITMLIIAFAGTLTLFNTGRIWFADTVFAEATAYSELGSSGKAYTKLSQAVNLRPNEPYYRNELGFSAASAALALNEEDATLSAYLKDISVAETEKSLNTSPKNVSFLRTAVRTYYQLSSIDPNFNDKTLQALDKSIELAPTDAKLYYNKALVLGQLGKNEEGTESLQKALKLKPNYRESYIALGLFYEQIDEREKAIEQMNIVLKLIPNDPEALEYLKKWEQK